MAMSMGGFAKVSVATVIVAADGSGDYLTIQEGIDALPAGGGSVYVKEGAYTITAAIDIISNNVAVTGAGASTIVQTTAADYLADILGNNVIIERMKFVGDRTSPQCIYVRTGDNVTIRDCYIYQTDIGILCHVGTVMILNNWIVDVGDNGIELGTPVFSSGSNFILGNKINGCDNHGINLLKSSSNIIEANNIRNNGAWGINAGASATYNNFVGNNLFNNTTGDLNIVGANNQTAHNVTT